MATISNKHHVGFEKWVKDMAEIKWVLLNVFGYTTYAWALFVSFANVDVFTRSVLSVVGLAFLITKLVVYIVSSRRKHKMEMLEIREKELSIMEREDTLIKSIKI